MIPTQQVIPEGTAGLVGWIKAAVRSVYREKGDCPAPPANLDWSIPDAAADMLWMQATRDSAVHPMTMPGTQVIVTAVTYSASTWVPRVTSLLQTELPTDNPYLICYLSFLSRVLQMLIKRWHAQENRGRQKGQ